MANELISFSDQLAAAVERASASVVAVQGRRRIGSSGFVWKKNLIVTANESVRFDDGIKVLLANGNAVSATLAGRDPATDLALLAAETGEAPPVEFAADASLKTGQLTLAVGRTAHTGVIASMGIVSGVSGEWKSWRGGRLDPFVRLDVSVYATSSGGAAVNAAGLLTGMVSTGLSPTSVLAITGGTINRVAGELSAKGYVGRGFIGISLQPVPIPEDLKQRHGIEQNIGIMLLGVEPAGPAAKGGLTIGDVLLGAGEHTLDDAEKIAGLLQATGVGNPVQFRILRGGEIQQVTVEVGERPRKGR